MLRSWGSKGMNVGQWMGIIVILIAIYILWEIRQLLLLIFTAVVLANALNLVVQQFQRLGLRRGYAVLLSVLSLLAVAFLFFWVIVPPFIEQLQLLALLVPLGIEQLLNWIEVLETRLPAEVINALPNFEQLVQQLQPIAQELLGEGLGFFANFLSILLSVLLVVVLTLMLLADPDPYRRLFVRLFPSFYRRRVDEILVLCEKALQGWLAGIVFNMAIITVLSLVGLMALGIELALAQALLAGLLTFIPNIGPALSVIPPVAIALLDVPWKSLAVLIVYIVIQQLESNLLTPLVMAQQVSLLPAVTLLAQVFFAGFFGFLGLLLALPLTVVGMVWIKEVLIKDVLDRWNGKAKPSSASEAEISTASLDSNYCSPPESEKPEQTVDSPPGTSGKDEP